MRQIYACTNKPFSFVLPEDEAEPESKRPTFQLRGLRNDEWLQVLEEAAFQGITFDDDPASQAQLQMFMTRKCLDIGFIGWKNIWEKQADGTLFEVAFSDQTKWNLGQTELLAIGTAIFDASQVSADDRKNS